MGDHCCESGFCSSVIIAKRKKVSKYLCLVYCEIAICKKSSQVKSQQWSGVASWVQKSKVDDCHVRCGWYIVVWRRII